MNKMKALIIAGLLCFSTVSFASSVSPSSVIGSAGTINLINGDGGVTVGGLFDASGSVFYDLSINGGALATIAMSFDVTPVWTVNDVQIAIYSSYDEITTLFSGLVANGTNNLSVALTAGQQYFLQFSGITGDSYNADIAAVPVPAAGILFATALLGAGAFGRRKKKTTKTSMVGAFTRAS